MTDIGKEFAAFGCELFVLPSSTERGISMNRKITTLVVGTLVAAGVQAQTNHFMWNDGSIKGTKTSWNTDSSVKASMFGDAAGKTRLISAEDNDSKNTFSFDTAISKNDKGDRANAFWIAVSEGPNPKGIAGELALLYFDASRAGAPVITAYGYNGSNGFDTYKDGSPAAGIQAPVKIASSLKNSSFVQESWYTEKDKYANDNTTMGFRINKSVINNFNGGKNWEGIDFSSKFGIWYHPVTEAETSYGADGFLTKFSFDQSGWVDLNDVKTGTGPTPVPEPASMAAIGLGIVGLLKRKRK